MAMMNVGKVRMRVGHGLVLMFMRMGLGHIHTRRMRMFVMFIVNMSAAVVC